MGNAPEPSPAPSDGPPIRDTGRGSSPSGSSPLRAVDFCAVAVAVVLVEIVSLHEMDRLRIDPLSVQSMKAVLVIRAAQIAAILVPLVLIRKIGPSAMGMRWGDWRAGIAWSFRVSAVLAMGFGLAALVFWLAGGGSLVRLAFGRSPLADAETNGARLAILAGVVVVGPLAEELFFRGGLYTVMRRSFSAPQTILVTALFFAAAHAGNSPFPVIQFVGGLAFGFLYERTGTLFAPVLVHAAGNLAILLLPIMVAA